MPKELHLCGYERFRWGLPRSLKHHGSSYLFPLKMRNGVSGVNKFVYEYQRPYLFIIVERFTKSLLLNSRLSVGLKCVELHLYRKQLVLLHNLQYLFNRFFHKLLQCPLFHCLWKLSYWILLRYLLMPRLFGLNSKLYFNYLNSFLQLLTPKPHKLLRQFLPPLHFRNQRGFPL